MLITTSIITKLSHLQIDEKFYCILHEVQRELLGHTEKSVFSKMIKAKNIFYDWHFF